MKALMVLGFALFAPSAFGSGGITGGGGDILRLRFIDGQRMGVSIIEAIDAKSLAGTDSVARKWLLENQKAYAADIAKSKHKWLEKTEQATCAWTQFESEAAIKLDFEKCRRSVHTEEAAAFILLHESAHHLGVDDEATADLIASAALEAWKVRSLTTMPMCPNPDNIVASTIIGEWEIDTVIVERMRMDPPEIGGKFAFRPDDKVAKFFPGLGKCAFIAGWWEGVVPKNVEEGREAYTFSIPFVLADLQGNPAIFYDEHDLVDLNHGRTPNYAVVEDLHPGYVMVAKSRNKDGDMLFIGGDNNNQPLYPFRRVKRAR